MVDVKISALPVTTALVGADLIPCVQSGVTKQISIANTLLSALTIRSAAGTAATTGLQVGAATVGLFSGGSGATEYLGLAANGLEMMRGVVPTASTALLTLTGSSGSTSLLLRNNTTDATTQAYRIGIRHQLNVEEPVGVIYAASSTGGNNTVLIGGGTSTFNAATLVSIYAAANATTVTGTELLRVTTAGVRIQSGVSAAASDIFHVANTAGTVDILRCSDSLGTVGIGGAPISAVGLSVTNTTEPLRLRYDASNYWRCQVSSGGTATLTSVTASSAAFRITDSGTLAEGLLGHLSVRDATAMALGVGGAIRLEGINTGSSLASLAAIKAYKENATDSETGGHLDCYSRTNGSNLAANLRVAASGATLARAGITTQVPHASAQFQVDSTTKGFLPPVMTEAQRDAIGTPTAGLVVYNSTTNLLNFYNGSAWGAI